MIDLCGRLAALAEDLKKNDIQFVDYGEILDRRFGYPAVIQTFKWAIPDTQLPLASDVLLKNDVPLGNRSRCSVMFDGEWETIGIMHKLADTRVHLIPLSFVRLSLSDCEEVKSMVSSSQKTLIPKPQPYLISLIRILMSTSLERRDPVSSELLIFLNYCVFPRLPDGEDEEDESEEHFQGRLKQALSVVRQWTWKPEEEKYLRIAEAIMHDCRLVRTLQE